MSATLKFWLIDIFSMATADEMKPLLALEGRMSNDINTPFLTEDCSLPTCRCRGLCCKIQMPTSDIDELVKALLVPGCAGLSSKGNASFSFDVCGGCSVLVPDRVVPISFLHNIEIILPPLVYSTHIQGL